MDEAVRSVTQGLDIKHSNQPDLVLYLHAHMEACTLT